MKLLQSQNSRILLGAGAVLAIAVAAFLTLTSVRAQTERLVEEIYTTPAPIKVQQDLKGLNDRGLALEVLKEYLNRDDDNIDGKVRIVTLLWKWKEARVVHRAFTSGPPSARRAVTTILYSSQRYHDEAETIALDWLRDANAPARHRAIAVVAQLKIEEALPDIEAILARVPESPQETLDFAAALRALRNLAPDKVGVLAVSVAKNKAFSSRLRKTALDVLRRVPDVPVDEVRDMLISYLLDPREDKNVRTTAAVDLKMQRYAGEKTWKALEEILLEQDVPLEQIVRQRSALDSLGAHMPLDRLKQLVTKRRVYTHRYLYIRQDAAVAMAMLGMKDKLTFDILTELLTDVEPEHSPYGRDEYFVRREAWLSLWTLFGMIPGASKPELFQRAPRMSTTRPARLFPWAQNRPGVNAEMVASLDPHSKDLEYMKRVQQQYRSLWAEIETRLAEEAKDAAQAPPPGGAKPPPGGTKPPPGATKPPPGAPPKDGPADKDAADKGADPGDKQEPAGDKQGKSEKSKDKGPPGPPPPTESKPAPASAARGLVDGIYTNKKMIRGERRELEVLRDRPGTLEVLSEYLNKDDDNIDGKVRLVSILLRWKQAHIVRRAFSSGPLSARRAVTARLYYAEGYQKKARTVTLEWLKDPGAPARHLAIEVAGRIRLSEALPVVQGILEKPPQGEQETLDFEAALRALPQLAPRTAGETALRVARDKRYTPSVHRAALSVLRRSEQVPVNEVRDLLISYLLDPREDKHVRTTAAVDLKMQRYAGEKTWKALEEILLEQDVPLEQIVRQRSALTSLGAHMPLDRLKQLVTNRRVYTHRYLYIRQDAAVAMALLGMKDKVTFDILTGHLTHTEQKGSPYQRDAYLVRREAWISLWSLFHMMAEPPRPEMFQKPPRAPAARPKDLFPWAFKRPGVTRSMMKEIDPVAKDLKSMKRIQHRYRALWPEIDARLLKEQPLAGCGG